MAPADSSQGIESASTLMVRAVFAMSLLLSRSAPLAALRHSRAMVHPVSRMRMSSSGLDAPAKTVLVPIATGSEEIEVGSCRFFYLDV